MIPLFLFLFSLSAFASKSNEIRVRLTEDLGTLDWNYGEVNPEVVNLLMEGLFRAGEKGEVKLAAAASYQWKNKHSRLLIKLREAKWSDGKKVCGEHFVDSWKRLLSKEFGSPYAHYAHGLKAFSSKNCSSLEIEFHRSSPEALAYLSHYVFFPWRKDQKIDAFTSGKELLVNGAYTLEKWEREKKIQLISRNKDSKKITFLIVPEDSTAQMIFESGGLDIIKNLPPMIRTEKNRNPKIFPTLVTFYFGINKTKVPDLNLRLALSQSLERQEITKVLGDEYEGSDRWLSEALLKNTRPPQKVDWSAARIEAKKTTLSLKVYQKGVNRLLAEWAQGQWEKKLGIRIPIEVKEGKVYWKEITQNSAAIFLSGVTAPYAHPRAFLQEFLSTSTANWTNWKSGEYDQAVNAQNFSLAENILYESGVVIPLFHRNTGLLLSPQAEKIKVNPLGHFIFP